MGGGRRAARAAMVGAALAAALAGCARYYWSKPGGTLDQFDRDNVECARASSANPTEAAHGIVNESLYRRCLEARQWVRKKERTPAPPGSYRGFE